MATVASKLVTLALALLILVLVALVRPAAAEDKPYFVTYNSAMEEPGNLEFSLKNGIGIQRAGFPNYFAAYTELEYGITNRWTTELTFEGQSTAGDSTIFTGWRWENRFHPLKSEHKINPILYFEFESLNEASRAQKEVVGHSMDFDETNAVLRRDRVHELEAKLILSSDFKGWNISENFITEKNITVGEGFEFGYAVGVSRALGKATTGYANCRACRQNFAVGVEAYGGLGSTEQFGFHDTNHYLAPVVTWKLSSDSALHFSPAFGLTHTTTPVLLRVAYSYEIDGFKNKVASLFRRH